MDQFCAARDDTYRRCICSSRLDDIKIMERALSQTQQQLLEFQDLNLDAISKTHAEVQASLTATAGEVLSTSKKDTSDSATKLAGISDVLNRTKSQSLSTAGTLDIAGNISEIWAPTDLIGAADISTFIGEKLYEQVHSQCAGFAATSCGRQSTLNMVISAYGMYIENDCNVLSTNLERQKTSAENTIRDAEKQMNTARLDTYNAHNSSSMSECLAQVRKDITSSTACGPNYVSCLDTTGQYLNATTGEPIYTPSFYKLGQTVSLEGDVLTNQTNHQLVATLNSKKIFAERGLNTCRDLSDYVWEEFMRRAIAEIYQGQQTRIRQVKNECISVVNECYDSTRKQLKDFSNANRQDMLSQGIETAEIMCQTKLNTCANLYGEGAAGLDELVKFVYDMQTSLISDNCLEALDDFVKKICSVQTFDTAHHYPYGCRMYAPGSYVFASTPVCAFSQEYYTSSQAEGSIGAGGNMNTGVAGYYCSAAEDTIGWHGKRYVSCTLPYVYVNGKCVTCPIGYGDQSHMTLDPITGQPNNAHPDAEFNQCYKKEGNSGCEDYPGSLHQQIAKYARGTCVRASATSEPGYTLPVNVLADVNAVMDTVKADMATVLRQECEETYNGVWSDVPVNTIHMSTSEFESFNASLNQAFRADIMPSTQWGVCYKTGYILRR